MRNHLRPITFSPPRPPPPPALAHRTSGARPRVRVLPETSTTPPPPPPPSAPCARTRSVIIVHLRCSGPSDNPRGLCTLMLPAPLPTSISAPVCRLISYHSAVSIDMFEDQITARAAWYTNPFANLLDQSDV
eukprot:6881968-Pyramimonas_sp.AAC.1